MTNLLEEVRAAVVKAVPELIESFPSCPDCGETLGKEEEQGYWFCPKCPLTNSRKEPGLSRPIRLADVLRTLQQACGTWDSVELWCNRESAELIFERGTYDGEGDERDLVKWNLAADNLDDQEQPTIAFIHKILVHE